MGTYSELVESLEKCVEACSNCAASCLNEEDVQTMTTCIKLDLDCADACQLALNLLARNSNHAKSAVEFCKYICAPSMGVLLFLSNKVPLKFCAKEKDDAMIRIVKNTTFFIFR